MNAIHIRSNARILTLIGVALLFASGLTMNRVQAQTKPSETNSAVTADQQKQLNHLRQLSDQLQKDRDAVDAVAGEYGWDSNEADAAQQRLFQDRQEYRSLRHSLQAAGVSIPSAARNGGTVTQGTQNGRCGSRGCDHHCDGGHDCGHDGDHCCHGHCT